MVYPPLERQNGKRAREIEREIQSRTHVWDAYDQGRWAHAKGFARADNPHYHPVACATHANVHDWWRGWDVEDERTDDVCSACGGSLDNGQGYDGRCGQCADQLEQQEAEQ